MKKIIIAIFIVANYAHAMNDCLIELYNEYLIQRDSIQIDSVYFIEGANDWSHKYNVNNGKYESLLFDNLDGSPTRLLKFLSNEADVSIVESSTVFKKNIINDEIIEELNDYDNGILSNSRKTIWTSDTISYTESSSELYQKKVYMNGDSLITINYLNSIVVDTTYVVRSNPELCLELDSSINEIGKYELNYFDTGFTNTYTKNGFKRIIFFKKTSSPLQTIRRVNSIRRKKTIGYDLLGRNW